MQEVEEKSVLLSDVLFGDEPEPCLVCLQPVPRRQGHFVEWPAPHNRYTLSVMHKACLLTGIQILNARYPGE